MATGRIGEGNTAIQPTIVDAKGDLIVATAADTVSRLAVGGTNGHVLKVNSATATGLEWGAAASGQLQEVVFTSSNASWTIPTGVTGIWALCVGSGGGGGATNASTSGAGAGGAGQVLEKFFTIAGGDTTLNITVPAGGAGATTAGQYGSSGTAATIVGNTSATTYVSAAGGGGGAGAATTATGTTGASGGGNSHSSTGTNGGGGGGMGSAATNNSGHPFAGIATTMGGGGLPTTDFVTGFRGGNETTNGQYGGLGVTMWGRQLAGGGNRVSGITTFGNGNGGQNVDGSNATANTGAGGGAAGTTVATKRNGGNGGSGLVVLRYVGA